MDSQKSFNTGMLAGVLLAMTAQAGNWLITPMSHPDASDARWAAVAAQGVLCGTVALWLVLRQRGRQAGARAD